MSTEIEKSEETKLEKFNLGENGEKRRNFIKIAAITAGGLLMGSWVVKEASAQTKMASNPTCRIIDDFSTGTYVKPPTHEIEYNVESTQNGSKIIGGSRLIQWKVFDNQRRQPMCLEIKDGYLNMNVGVTGETWLGIQYPASGKGLHEDFSACQGIRFNYDKNNCPLGRVLTFNLTLYCKEGAFRIIGKRPISSNPRPFSEEFRFSDDTQVINASGGKLPDLGFSEVLRDVNALYFQFSAAGNFAISSIELF